MIADYFPTIVAFVTAIVAIVAETKRKDAIGFKRVTTAGWVILAIAVASLGLNVATIHQKRTEALDARKVRLLAQRQIAHGIGQILRHTVQAPLPENPSNNEYFAAAKSDAYLDKLSQKSVYFPFLIGHGDQAKFARPDYEFWIEDIRAGEALVADAIQKYAAYLDSKTVALTTELLQDDFFRTDFRFDRRDNQQTLIPVLMKQQNVVSSYLGTWYFGGHYDNDTQQISRGDYRVFIAFISKVERLIDHLNSNGSEPINLFKP